MFEVPKYIRRKMSECASLQRKSCALMQEIEEWLEKNGFDIGELRSGNGFSLEELEYGNDVSGVLCDRLEEMKNNPNNASVVSQFRAIVEKFFPQNIAEDIMECQLVQNELKSISNPALTYEDVERIVRDCYANNHLHPNSVDV